MPAHALSVTNRYGPRAGVSVWLWLVTSVVGTGVAVLALREVAQNWVALAKSQSSHAELLASILATNLYQQIGRLVMEGLCLTAGLLALTSPVQVRPRNMASTATAWLLVAFRVMLVTNNTVEYWSQRRQRASIARESEHR